LILQLKHTSIKVELTLRMAGEEAA
jgi:hypothetical protein